MKSRTLRRWSSVHTWSSLVCTLFLFILCVSGLPLLFRDEIDSFLYDDVAAQSVPPNTPAANLDKVVATGLAHSPNQVVQFIIWDRDDPNVVTLGVGESESSPSERNRIVRVDAHTAGFLDAPDMRRRISNILLRLHSELFAGLLGSLFVGVMALLFVISIVSGVVVYGPSMRKLDFGTVRKVRTRRIFWLDLHNLIGITLIVWTLVVGITGLINTWADSALKYWQQSQLKELSQAAKEKGKGLAPISVQSIVARALNVAPGMVPLFVAYPGSAFSTDSHYVVFLRGEAALTSRLVQPIVVDAKTGLIASIPIVPWYIKGLLLSQPLHFANYGGLPLRIVWALLDVLTIILLASGFYLWLVRRASAQRWQMQAKRSTAL